MIEEKWRLNKDNEVEVYTHSRFFKDDYFWHKTNQTLENLKEWREDQWLEESGIPYKFIDATFETFDRSQDHNAYDTVMQLSQRLQVDYCELPNSAILYSPNRYGCGKTHPAVALLQDYLQSENPVWVSKKDNRIIFRNCPGVFISLPILLSNIRATFQPDSKETERSIIKKLEDIVILVLDDVDKYRVCDLSFTKRILFGLIDARYTNQRPIIMTTNLSLAGLRDFIGGASASRLTEMAEFIEFIGEDYRIFKRSSKSGNG